MPFYLYVLAVLAAWKPVWWLIYCIAGVSIGSVTINNGISFNNIYVTTRKARVYVRLFRLRLWGNSRRVIVSGLDVRIEPGGLKLRSDCKTTEGPVRLFPNGPPRVFEKLLYWIPNVNVELMSSLVHIGNDDISLDYVHATLRSHRSASSVTLLHLSHELTVHSVVCNESVPDKLPRFTVGTISVHVEFVIEPSSVVHSVRTRVYVDQLELSVFHLLKSLFKVGEKSERADEKQPLQARIDRMVAVHNKLIQTVQDVSLNVTNSQVSGIPFFDAFDQHSINAYVAQQEPGTSLALAVKAVTLHAGRLLENSAGFDVLFHRGDRPVQVTVGLQILQVFVAKTRYSRELQRLYTEHDEICNVLSINSTTRSNIPDRLAQGLGFKDCVLETFSSATSPVVDLDAMQCAMVVYNYLVYKKLFKLHGLKTKTEPPTQVASPVPGKGEVHRGNVGDRIVRLLNENYPHIELNFILEQPRAMVRCASGSAVHIVDFAFTMLQLNVLTLATNRYDVVCDVLHPCVAYTERGDRACHEDLCGFSMARALLEVYANLRVKANALATGAFVNLNKPSVLTGVNTLITTIGKATSQCIKVGLFNQYYEAELVQEVAQRAPQLPRPRRLIELRVFARLPAWLVSAELNVLDSTFSLGSTSPLLPPELINKLSVNKSDTSDGTRITFSQFSVGLCQDDDDASSTNSSSSSLSSTTLADKTTYWRIRSSLQDFEVSVVEDLQKPATLVSILGISSVIAGVEENGSKKVVFDNVIDDLTAAIDRYKVFAVLGLAHLLVYTIVLPIKEVKSKLSKNLKTVNADNETESKPDVTRYLHSSVRLATLDIVVHLDNSFKMRLQLRGVSLFSEATTLYFDIHFLRILADSMTVKGFWNRLVCVDSFAGKVNDPAEDNLICIKTPSIRIIHPHRFIMHQLFDHISIFVKIMKHLVRCIKSTEKTTTVYPTESKPLPVPTIKLEAGKLMFTMEDDPFESELNANFQLGLVEQRKRTEMIALFNERVSENDPEYDDKLSQLQVEMSALWIRKVHAHRDKMAQEMLNNKEFLFGNELEIEKEDNSRICSYMKQQPLLVICLEGLELLLASPEFLMLELPDFIHDMGQGVPKDTRYNIMIPVHMSLRVIEGRMHLRDYPLPLLHLPRAQDSEGRGRALGMSGHLAICEAFTLDEKQLRDVKVQLSKTTEKSEAQPNRFDKLLVKKTLATVKMYTDLNVVFDLDSPSRFIWGQLYNFGLQQVMLNFDSFSKPPVDPSTKLGFWDKLRYIMHGKFVIKAGEKSSIEVGFKGGRDPYNVFDDSAGFVLKFFDEVVWEVNKYDDLLRFFEVSSNSVSWYIPNYLAAPIPVWSRSGNETVFVPHIKSVMSSLFGYYLNVVLRPLLDYEKTVRVDVEEKQCIQLSGGIKYVVGFLLQREIDGKITEEGRPHYDIHLCNPKFAEKGHDSYAGFRSVRLHMAMELDAHTESSYNTIHLSPGALDQYTKWYTMFQGNMMLPIRKGKLFTEEKEALKFSQHLYTNKFLFQVKDLFISHIYRNDQFNSSDDSLEYVGVRAKVSNFMVDLHQRKEERISVREDLSRKLKVMKMVLNLGEIMLSNIDLRVIQAKFHQNVYGEEAEDPKSEKFKLEIFDEDEQWFDWRDYDEAFSIPTRGRAQRVSILPMLYTDRFSYIKDTTSLSSEGDWGNEDTHDCHLHSTDVYLAQMEVYHDRLKVLELLEPEAAADAKETLKRQIGDCAKQKRMGFRRDSITTTEQDNFHNHFVLVRMLLKWNTRVRNHFLKYVHFVQLRSNIRKYISNDMMALFAKYIEQEIKDDDADDATAQANKLKDILNGFRSSAERLANFEEIIRTHKGNERIVEAFKIEVVAPQIQLHCEEEVELVVLITAPVLESKILLVYEKKDLSLVINPNELEKRYGVLLHDANITVIRKDEVGSKRLVLEDDPYGTTGSWPPWLGVESAKQGLISAKDLMLVRKMSFMLTFYQVKAQASSSEMDEQPVTPTDALANKFRIDIPEVTINCTSKQYYALYVTVLRLLLYAEPMHKHLSDKLEKLRFSLNLQDPQQIFNRLNNLRDYLLLTKLLLRNYNFRRRHLDNAELNEYVLLNQERQEIGTEMFLTLQLLVTGDMGDLALQNMVDWRIGADRIVLRMLEDNLSPLMDVVIDRGRFKRVIKEDGYNDNRIEIRSIEAHNRVKGAYFSKFCEPVLRGDKDMIAVDWLMNRVVGGIRLMENFEISLEPLNIKLDEMTGKKLTEFVFQTDEKNVKSSPLLRRREEEEKEKARQEREKKQAKEEKEDKEQKPGQQASVRRRLTTRGSFKSNGSGGSDVEGDLQKMMERSEQFLSVTRLKFRAFQVMISLRLKSGVKRLLNVTNFLLHLPGFTVLLRIMLMLDVAELMKRMVIKSILGHLGRLVVNKLTVPSKNAERRIEPVESMPELAVGRTKKLKRSQRRDKDKRKEQVLGDPKRATAAESQSSLVKPYVPEAQA